MERSDRVVYRADDGRWYLQVFVPDGTSTREQIFIEKGAVLSATIKPSELSRALMLASSVLEGVQELETTTPNAELSQQTVDEYIGSLVADLAKADAVVWGVVDDFKGEGL